jgi:hypothetical protein
MKIAQTRQRLEDRLRLLFQIQVDDRLSRRHDLPILDEVGKMAVFLLANRRFE